jgi:magnesium transporter
VSYDPLAEFLFLTELQGLKVYDLRGHRLGQVRDAALLPVTHTARVDRFLVSSGWTWWTVRFDQVASISLGGIRLRAEDLTPFHDDEYMLRLAEDLLDQQIIDAQGRKVVRVTDLTLRIRREESHDVLLVEEVDIGLRSILRRLLQGVVPRRVVRHLQALVSPRSIPWEYCNIIEADPLKRLRLNISHKQLEAMHPADLADIVEDLSPDDRSAIIGAIDSEVAADALSEVEPRIQARIVEALGAEKAADIIEEMAPDAAADLLGEVGEETSQEILGEMAAAPKSEVSQLLKFGDDRAGGLMNTEAVLLPAKITVAGVWPVLVERQDLLEELNTVFLTDDGRRVVAMVPLARLVLAADESRLEELATDRLVSVAPEETLDRVFELFDKYNLQALPVLSKDGGLVGVITADDVIAELWSR